MCRHTALIGTSLVALMTASCAPMGSTWTGIESPKSIDVQTTADSYVVKLAGNARSLPVGEREELRGFLNSLGNLNSVEFSIRRTHKGLSVDSLKPVERELIAMGADGRKIYRLAEIGFDYVGHWADVEIIAKRYVAIAPNCPDWSRSEIMDGTNENSSNFGCATASALAMSVADPRDLERGRTLDPASGVHGAAAVDRYNTDQIRRLPESITSDVAK